MATRGKKKKKQSIMVRKLELVSLLLLVMAFFAGTLIQNIQSASGKTRVEDQASEMKEIPLEFKNRLKNVNIASKVRIPILLYHYVEYVQDSHDLIRKSLDITPNVFEQQLLTLKNAGYTFITPQQLSEVLDKKNVLPPNPIILSFDDGYRDFYTDVFPLLKKYHVKAVSYVVPGFTGQQNYMDHEMVQHLVDSGLVEIGAHTVDHLDLKGAPLQRVRYEIEESKKMLDREYHLNVVSFAYPYGGFDNQAVSFVEDAKFTTAVSTVPGVEATKENRFFLFRIRPGYRTGQELLNFLHQDEFKAF